MLNFEQYLSDFNSTINIWAFVLNLFIVTVLAYMTRIFYIKWGRAISDRRKFSNNFIPLALGTLLIITVIKSSIALSLGLVGALSIVRFRAAIKDPEELTFLFLIIALGLIGGANKPILAVLSFALILPLLYINNKLANRKLIKNKAFLHIDTAMSGVEEINKRISDHVSFLELRRVDYRDEGISASFFCTLDSPEKLDAIRSTINEIDQKAKISFVDQPDLLL